MFATGESCCPVALFKSYLSKRPGDLKLSHPFYLPWINNPTTVDVWYKKSQMGKNTMHQQNYEKNERKLTVTRYVS